MKFAFVFRGEDPLLRSLVALVQGNFHDIEALFLYVLMTNRAGLSGRAHLYLLRTPFKSHEKMSMIDEVKNIDGRFADCHLR